jgi:hypothetical protein
MADEWRKLSDVEKRDFMSRRGVRKTGEHRMTRKVLHWRACTRCGLMNLRNDATRKALAKPCVWEEDV